MKIKITRHIALLIASLLCISRTGSAQVVINEYSCSNTTTIQDNFFQYEDWIELYNTGNVAVNLTGYYLSDNAALPTKWQIANANIPANGRILIYASGNNITNGTLHTSFKITQTKFEQIVLSNAGGQIIDSLTVKLTQNNHSRGRTTDGAATWSVFTTPNPNAANTNAKQDYTPRPTFNIAPGFYGGAQNIILSTIDPNAQIRYTTDGSVPTIASTLYAAPINVASTTVIRAKGFSNNPNVPASFTETNTYFINVNHSLPVVSVASANYTQLFNTAQPIVSSIEYFDKNKVFQFETEGDVDKHGNDSWQFPQKGIDFVASDEYGYDAIMDYPIFSAKNRTKFDRVILKAAASDNYPFAQTQNGVPGCHLRDAFVQTISQKGNFEMDERSTESCILFINGQYWGVYELREKVDHHNFTNFYYNQDEKDIDVLAFWGGLNIKYGSDTAWVNLYTFIMSHNMANATEYAYVDSLLSYKSVIDNIILNTYVVNSDWISWNTMWWRGRNPNGNKKKWRYACWDQDNVYDLGENYAGWPNTGYTVDPCALDNIFANAGPEMGHLDIFTRLMQNADFKSMYVNRYVELINTHLSCDSLNALLGRMINVLTPEMPAQIARWGGNMAGWQANLAYIQQQINGRCSVIDSLFKDCYDLDGPFVVTFTVSPPLSGDVKISQYTPGTYPWTANNYFGGVTIPLQATAANGYVFDHWERKIHPLLPDTLTTNVKTILNTSNDTIIAFFKKIEAPIDSVIPKPPIDSIFVLTYPNIFTPNGDGQNDFFMPVKIQNATALETTIFNRYGSVVYKSNELKATWDGTCNKKECPAGVYFYIINYTDNKGNVGVFKGHVTLLK